MRDEVLADLRGAGELVEERVAPEETFGGWSGHDVLVHLAAYTRVVCAIVRGVAEGRDPTEAELFGRELTEAERAMSDLDAVNQAVVDEFAHLSHGEALAMWRDVVSELQAQAGRLSEEQLAAPVPETAPNWQADHLYELVARVGRHYHAHMLGQAHQDA
jgi:hypothetical protein